MTRDLILRRLLPSTLVFLAVLAVVALPISPTQATTRARVFPGVDVLLSTQSEVLNGKRIGLITHRAATGVGGHPTMTLLSFDPRIRLVALFAPEHGLSGALPAGAVVPSTGGQVPIYSLYSETRRPTAEMLNGIDALVFDLQDVGARAYTYISTMALAMQSAAEYDKLFVVLDRPNPLGGERVDGPVLRPAFGSFIGIYPVPAIHGMTVGELAMLFNREFGIGAKLMVIPMTGWRGEMEWEDTGLLWFRPSPMIQSPIAAQLHAATGMLEGTNLTVGAGTRVPFETVTAPWISGERLAERLNQYRLPGVRFLSHSAGTASQRQGGVRLVLADTSRFLPATTALHILVAVRDLYPGRLEFDRPVYNNHFRFDLVWGTDAVRKAILRGEPAERIAASWASDLNRFAEVRRRYLLYPRSSVQIVQPQPAPVALPRAIPTKPAAAAPPPRNPADVGAVTRATALSVNTCERAAICGGLIGAGR